MSDVGMQLRRLKSPNKDTRYEACEELRVAESLPQEAIAALKLATKDEDPLVSDAARRAILIHSPPPTRSPSQVQHQGKKRLENPIVDVMLALPIGVAIGAFGVWLLHTLTRIGHVPYGKSAGILFFISPLCVAAGLAAIGLVLARSGASRSQKQGATLGSQLLTVSLVPIIVAFLAYLDGWVLFIVYDSMS